MSDYHISEASPPPTLRKAEYADIATALRRGWGDFRRVPFLALFFGGFYAVGGMLIFWLLSAYGKPWMIVPLAIGFPLVGPFLAAGTYELSRRLDAGEPVEPGSILTFMVQQGRREFVWMAFVVLFIFWIWMYQARILIALFLDMQAFASPGALAAAVFTTPEGLTMIAISTVSGGILATILYASTVMAIPMLVERELDIVTALIASWKAVLASPGPMLAFGAVVGGIAILSATPMFLGLLAAFPVLGFATWHLYRMLAHS